MGSQIIKGAKWTAVERFSNQFIQLAVSIVISRLISPEEFGVLAILLVFVNIAQVFIDSGLGNSLIYFNKIDKDDLNTTFIFNAVISGIIFSLLFVIAPYIEQFYSLKGLTEYLRIASIVLLANSVAVVPTAILKINLNFKSLATANLAANIFSAIIGIALAIIGAGVWALIGQMLSRSLILALLMLIKSKWVPKFCFVLSSFKKLYRYGVNLFATSIITKFTDEGIATLIGKFLTPYNLGLFSRSGQFATFPTSCIGSLVTTVTFPALSAEKDNIERYNRLYLNALELQAFLVIPLYFWLAVEAKPLIILLLTDKWIDAVPIFQILCIGRILALLAITTEQNLNAKGRSDLCLKQQFFKLLLKIVLVFAALPFGIIAVALADAVQTLVQFYITNKVAENTIGFTFRQQLKLAIPYLLSAMFASIVAYIPICLIENYWIQILLSTLLGIGAYLVMVFIFFKKREPYFLLKKFI